MKKRNQQLAAFGDRVKQLRLEKELSQELLAEECGIGRATLSRIETGAYVPKLTTIFSLAEGLNVNIKELFD